MNRGHALLVAGVALAMMADAELIVDEGRYFDPSTAIPAEAKPPVPAPDRESRQVRRAKAPRCSQGETPMRFDFVATYATPGGNPATRSGTIRAASMDAARSKLRDRFKTRSKLDLTIRARMEAPDVR